MSTGKEEKTTEKREETRDTKKRQEGEKERYETRARVQTLCVCSNVCVCVFKRAYVCSRVFVLLCFRLKKTKFLNQIRQTNHLSMFLKKPPDELKVRKFRILQFFQFFS